MDDTAEDSIRRICDLRKPEDWYLGARGMNRKIFIHVGPTNSGKTYNALEQFRKAPTGIYCAPLRLLAQSVYTETNTVGVSCDLRTGEEFKRAAEVSRKRKWRYGSNQSQEGAGTSSRNDQKDANHLSCTVHMADFEKVYHVGVIDEIQMIANPQRGEGWTKAFFGLKAEELHLCGEKSALDIIKRLIVDTGDELVEENHCQRLTHELRILPTAFTSFQKARAGDCIVCFSVSQIHHVVRELRKAGHRSPAVIYGRLPPQTKRKQADEFNRHRETSILVATDAIGMGLNLNIKRIIFFTLQKTQMDMNGVKESRGDLTPSEAQHIAGRAGRYKSKYPNGEVTTFRSSDLPLLRQLLNTPVPSIERAGLLPTDDSMNKLYKHFTHFSFTRLTQEFRRRCNYDKKKYFLCPQNDLISSSELLSGIDLPMEEQRYFCSAPLPGRATEVRTWLTTLASCRQKNQRVTSDWLKEKLHWPPSPATNLFSLSDLENKSDILALYMWLGMRMPQTFPDGEAVESMHEEVEPMINHAVKQMDNILAGTGVSIDPTLDVNLEEAAETGLNFI